MHKLLVLYSAPKDPEHFKKHYESVHLPLAAKLPGLKASRHSFEIKAMGGPAPYFCIFEGEFENEAAMKAALQSKEGQAVAADVPKYATGGVAMLHYSASR
jgi:uncharacterized protein (TIGR02118 family)